MKRLLQAVLVVGVCSLLATGCSSPSEPAEPVTGMLKSLYFKDGSYQDYRALFQSPDKVISEQEFKGIQEKGATAMFGDKAESDVFPMLRSYQKDETTAVVYWVDFTKDKSKDLHWNVVKADDGWKIEN